MNTSFDLKSLMISIQLGDLDEHKNAIYAAFDERKRRQNIDKINSLQIGDRVQYIAGRPRYLIGTTGTVTKVKQAYVLVKLDAPVGKFTGIVNTPISLIEVIKTDEIPALQRALGQAG